MNTAKLRQEALDTLITECGSPELAGRLLGHLAVNYPEELLEMLAVLRARDEVQRAADMADK